MVKNQGQEIKIKESIKENMKTFNVKNFNFNSIDMFIIMSIWLENNNSSVSQIRKNIDIAPNNLTAHLKKLEKMNIINVKDQGIGKKKEISLNFDNLSVASLIEGTVHYFLIDRLVPEEKEKKRKDIENFKKGK